MLRWALLVTVLGAACSGPTAAPTTAETLPPPSTIVVTTTTIPRPAPLPICEPPEYFPSVLPRGVLTPGEDDDLAADRYTAIEGTSTIVFVDESSQPKVLIVRGSLPPEEWAGRTVRVAVAGFDAALGTMPDGAWAVAWAESGSRCDQHTLIVYPPTTREEVTVIAEGLRR